MMAAPVVQLIVVALLVLIGLGAAEARAITVPAGFRLEVVAGNLGGARGLALDPAGVLLVSIPAKGRVVAVPAGGAPVTLVADLDLPHGLAFRRGHLYVAETGRIVRYRYHSVPSRVRERRVVVSGLPHSAHHWTRSIAFGPDDKLYVAIGSSCDVCEERDPRRAAIVRYDADGSGEHLFARGLRNPVGLGFHPRTGALWTTVNERDWPGGGAPPDYITEVRPGATYGWPHCFAERHVWRPDPTWVGPRECRGATLPTVELVPHSAPLGLAFYTGTQFPRDYAGDLFVALHGSRAGLSAAGYKIVRVRFRDGRVAGVEDFVGGWRQGERIIGRPVDLVVGRDGSLYVSDDHGDRVYRVTYGPR
jgi:glucose/arabinose dehydrogenase